MVLYSIIGFLIGCCDAYIISKMWDIIFLDNTFSPAQEKINLLAGGIIGGLIGFGTSQ